MYYALLLFNQKDLDPNGIESEIMKNIGRNENRSESLATRANNNIDLFLRPCLCYHLQSIEQNMCVLL